MEMHKFEKIWLTLGSIALIAFLIVLGVSAFYLGNQPPSCAVTLDPKKVDEHQLFKEPGLTEIGENEYQLTVVSSAFDYNVGNPEKIVEIPKGATVHISTTTKDVIHGFEIAGTNVNMMVEPGYISTYTNTFDKAGTYTLVCNEYCGVGHHLMQATIEVVE